MKPEATRRYVLQTKKYNDINYTRTEYIRYANKYDKYRLVTDKGINEDEKLNT